MRVLYTILTLHYTHYTPTYLEEASDEDERGADQHRDELLGVDPRQQRHQLDEEEPARDEGAREDCTGEGHGLSLHGADLAHLPVVGRGVNQRIQCASWGEVSATWP